MCLGVEWFDPLVPDPPPPPHGSAATAEVTGFFAGEPQGSAVGAAPWATAPPQGSVAGGWGGGWDIGAPHGSCMVGAPPTLPSKSTKELRAGACMKTRKT